MSILHVEREKLSDVLRKMFKALKDGGIIYTSFKIGNYEVVQEGKYYNYITSNILEEILKQIEDHVEIIDYFENVTGDNVDRPSAKWGGTI